jgi:hypothetical protein
MIPKTKNKLVEAISFWWATYVDGKFVNKKIDTLYKVRDRCIKLRGKATGF